MNDKKDYIIRKLTNEILELREHISILNPDFYKQLVNDDRQYCRNLGHDIRTRIKIKSVKE